MPLNTHDHQVGLVSLSHRCNLLGDRAAINPAFALSKLALLPALHPIKP